MCVIITIAPVRNFVRRDIVVQIKRLIWPASFIGVTLSAASTAASHSGALAAAPETLIGVNVTSPNYYSHQRAFANLAIGDSWRIVHAPKEWSEFPREYVLSDGGLSGLPAGSNAVRMLTAPVTGAGGANIRCTWQGGGTIVAKGAVSGLFTNSNQLSFHWVNDWKSSVYLQVSSVDPQKPILKVDCRETDIAGQELFAPAFVKDLTGYKVLRFMDWSRSNFNVPVTWATRTQPGSIEVNRADGVAIEDMMALAMETGASPWFSLPWNADHDYYQRYAQYVHDTLPTNRTVYVELGNEIWNTGFPASKQATAEGLASGLADNPRQANLRRLAQRTVEVMKIWEQVFADNPKRLVRVIATQHVVPDAAAQVLAYGDTAAHVDALATAPYFGLDLMQEGQTADLDEIFRRLDNRIDKTIDLALANRAVAAKYGKRYVGYEAGQHIVIPYNVPLTIQIQHNQRMYDVYKRYIKEWRTRVGDTINFFGSVGVIGPGGAWGLVEHSGQPASEAPKLRAVLEERDHS